MLVLSRKPGERIVVRPHHEAEEARDLLRLIKLAMRSESATACKAYDRLEAILEQLAAEELEVLVVRLGPNHCKLGIAADRGRDILRAELTSPPTHNEAAA